MQRQLQCPLHPHALTQQPEQRLHEELPRIARRLRIAGVATVRIEYEGHWGFAHVDLVAFRNAQDKEIKPSVSTELTEQLDDYLRELLDARYPKWADDAGAFGHFTWSLLGEALTHEHNSRYVAFNTTIHLGL